MKTSVNLPVLLFQSLSFLSLMLSFIHDCCKLDRPSNLTPYRNLCERVAVRGHKGSRASMRGVYEILSKMPYFLPF